MKLDADIIRKILLTVESSDEWVMEISDMPEDIFKYHGKHLIEANFMSGAVLPNGQSNIPVAVTLRDLTWNGHEFLKAIKDETLWNKAKEHIVKPAASWTIGILFEYLKAEIGQRVGL